MTELLDVLKTFARQEELMGAAYPSPDLSRPANWTTGVLIQPVSWLGTRLWLA
ncbi:hypothetical protein NONI108955_38330 [Nocardia ninae]|uniref:hypothetical protein n=1 Tax=Nocardia ninae TaxID=356145 RepID=UPI001649D048|nr:hypothetical protein [Nocardia ninae]